MIEVISPGIFTSIQDQGRFGYRNIGVPVAGVMDQYSAFIANSLVGNCADRAVLEMSFHGPTLKFMQDCYIAVSGGAITVQVNAVSKPMNTVLLIKKGEILKLGAVRIGVRSYLAVAGGIDSESILNSQSFYQGITTKYKIEKADMLFFNQNNRMPIKNRSAVRIDPQHFYNQLLEVVAGPEFDILNRDMKAKLFRKKFTITSQSNRMAYKFEIHANLGADEIITSSVQPGTVQLTPSGEVIVLMRDCQSTGGYARVLQLTQKSINQMSQKTAGSEINFNLLTLRHKNK